MKMIWPKVFTDDGYIPGSVEEAKVSLFTMQALLLTGNKIPENFGKGCVELSKILGMNTVSKAMSEVGNTLSSSMREHDR